jgi:hypothetical protein
MASQLSAAASMSAAVPQFHGLRSYASPRSVAALPPVRAGRKRAQGIRCDYIGSATNQVIPTNPDELAFALNENFVAGYIRLTNGRGSMPDHGAVDDADAVRGAVRAGAVGEPEGDGGAEAGVPRLGPADRRPRRVHARRHAGLRRRRPHHRRRHRARAQEHRRARPDHRLGLFTRHSRRRAVTM